MSEFKFEKPFQFSTDETRYRFLGNEGVTVEQLGEHTFLKVAPEVLSNLAGWLANQGG